jgi:GxxExxY protein
LRKAEKSILSGVAVGVGIFVKKGRGEMMEMSALTEKVIGCAIEVHRNLGPGLLESTYRKCLAYELNQAGLRVEIERPLPVHYKGIELDCGYRLDLVVEEQLILEIKAIDMLLPIHDAQLLTYLKLTDRQVGLLLNFNVRQMKDGIKRLVNRYQEQKAS